LFHPRFNLLDMVPAVVSLAYNDVEVALSLLSRNPNPLFQHILCLLHEQAVQIDGVAGYAALCVVLAENVVARLVIVLVHFRGVLFTFF
jgi:hypothetical protein